MATQPINTITTPKEARVRSGFGYFASGVTIAFTPGIRKFVILPLITNILLVGGALFYLLYNLNEWLNSWLGGLPNFLEWLHYLLWPFLALTAIATCSYFFSTIANFIAAPLNGLLAEKVEQHLSGHNVEQTSLTSVIKDIPRVLKREWRKLVYIVPKAIGLFIILLIPALGQTLGPLLWFVFTAWMIAVQYCDYPFDNHKIAFDDMRQNLKSKQSKAYGFGTVVTFLTSIPIINLFVMPVAVCGATAMWVAEFKSHQQH